MPRYVFFLRDQVCGRFLLQLNKQGGKSQQNGHSAGNEMVAKQGGKSQQNGHSAGNEMDAKHGGRT
jgi:hypothetical protein